MGEVLDGAAVRRWCGLAAEALGRTRAEIDALNVFPVPDGDTGTNLHLTVLAAADAVQELPEDADTQEVPIPRRYGGRWPAARCSGRAATPG
ncbi:hypothetical protein [Actinomadura rupiterrae]|uniref:hypothetical protein n=1 Tax=Actinomadura rupiterrae TaxID=559627 RepID=UPI0020A385D9|nr:hypothetical protein [Actinomadura rupiterrae]MCP2339746.1 dihydroxyacetone kinase-like predicted kinase [Actinomadura rupiterrae]